MYIGGPLLPLFSFTTPLFNLKSIDKFNINVTFLISEGRKIAEEYDCKYTEVSAAFNHKVDDLLVGILKQIRLNPERTRKQRPQDSDQISCVTKAHQNVLSRILKGTKRMTKSCENLLTL